MEGALAAKMMLIVVVVLSHVGAVPTNSPSQEELAKAKVNMICMLISTIPMFSFISDSVRFLPC